MTSKVLVFYEKIFMKSRQVFPYSAMLKNLISSSSSSIYFAKWQSSSCPTGARPRIAR